MGCGRGTWGGRVGFRGEGGDGPEDDAVLIGGFGEDEIAVPGYTEWC